MLDKNKHKCKNDKLIEKADYLLVQRRLKEAIQGYKEVIQMSIDWPTKGYGNRTALFLTLNAPIEVWYINIKHQRGIYNSPYDGLSLCHFMLGDTNEAIEWYSGMLEKHPKSYQLTLSLGHAYYNSGLIKQAEQYYLKTIKLKPTCGAGYEGLALISLIHNKDFRLVLRYARSGALNESSSVCRLVQLLVMYAEPEWLPLFSKLELSYFIERTKYNIVQDLIYYEAGKSLYLASKYEEARQIFEESLVVNPQNWRSARKIGFIYYKKTKDNDKAIEWFELCTKIDKNQNEDLFYKLAQLYYDKNKYQEAQFYCRQYLKTYDPEIQAYFLMGNILTQNCKHKKALEAFDLFIQRSDKDLHYAYNIIGNIHSDLKDYNRAIEAYIQANRLDTSYNHPYYGIGNAYADLKKFEEAIVWYTKAIELDPNYSSAIVGLGMSYADMENYEEAMKWYQHCMKVDPNYYKSYHQAGEMNYKRKNYAQAIRWYEQCLLIRQDFAECQYYLTWAQIKCGRFAEASETIKKIGTMLEKDRKISQKKRKRITKFIQRADEKTRYWKKKHSVGRYGLMTKSMIQYQQEKYQNQFKEALGIE